MAISQEAKYYKGSSLTEAVPLTELKPDKSSPNPIRHHPPRALRVPSLSELHNTGEEGFRWLCWRFLDGPGSGIRASFGPQRRRLQTC